MIRYLGADACHRLVLQETSVRELKDFVSFSELRITSAVYWMDPLYQLVWRYQFLARISTSHPPSGIFCQWLMVQVNGRFDRQQENVQYEYFFATIVSDIVKGKKNFDVLNVMTYFLNYILFFTLILGVSSTQHFRFLVAVAVLMFHVFHMRCY